MAENKRIKVLQIKIHVYNETENFKREITMC